MNAIMLPEKQPPEIISHEARIAAQASIYRMENLVENRVYSRERVWREFLDRTSKQLGSSVRTIGLLADLGYADQQILELLKVSAYSNKQIAALLGQAGWSDARMAAAVMWLKDIGQYEYCGEGQADIDALDFLLSSGIGDSRVIAAMARINCFSRKAVCRLVSRGWSELRLFQAIVEGGCFDNRSYQMLLGPKDKRGESPWNDSKFLDLMSQWGKSDGEKVALFRGAGKVLRQIYQLCSELGWPQDRIIAAFVEAGHSPGDIACAYDGFAKTSLAARPEYGSTRSSDYSRIEAEKESIKITVVTMLEKMMSSDGGVVAEFCDHEWPNSMIIDYLLAARWTPERIIVAMLEIGWTEYFITKMLNEAAEEFEFKRSNYWEKEQIDLWKSILRRQFPKGRIIKAFQP